MLGLFFVSALFLGGFGHNVDIGTVELNKKPPFVHIDESKGVIEYTYPTGKSH